MIFINKKMNIISLGNNCITSQYLKLAKLKNTSYPFDWIFSSIDIIKDCIEDDFNKFLDTTLMTTLVKKRSGHETYHRQMFNHRQPSKNKEDLKYYQRCCDRFKKLFKSDQEITFVLYVRKGGGVWENKMVYPIDQSIEKIKEFCNYISSKRNNTKFIIIRPIVNSGKAKFEKPIIIDNMRFFKFHSVGKPNGSRYPRATDHKEFLEFFKKLPILTS